MDLRAFSPRSKTANINVSNASQRVLLTNRNGPVTVRVMNDGSATVWLNWGDVTVASTTSSGLPVGPGVHEVLTFAPAENGDLYVAAIAAGSTGKIYFTVGEGI